MGASESGAALLLKKIAVCAGWTGVGAGLERAAGGNSHRHKVTIHAINNHMLASIRWQTAPG